MQQMFFSSQAHNEKWLKPINSTQKSQLTYLQDWEFNLTSQLQAVVEINQ